MSMAQWGCCLGTQPCRIKALPMAWVPDHPDEGAIFIDFKVDIKGRETWGRLCSFEDDVGNPKVFRTLVVVSRKRTRVQSCVVPRAD
ncbi:hypothetical protein TNIN_164741 [Trichonephila inaurata madagascariensis]|uniref:Uncharacterized protein n=1 Tax=Trichonephila inaurata madagascariensis TaxID=2747483 RepID=A0A8X6XU02_9ARAC|nr:hypothetical protein TNIN_164741 [Trichonephila inaurata madagascariensis]